MPPALRLGLLLGVLLPLAGCGESTPPPAVDDGTELQGIDKSALDLGAQPCDDFYQYACGGFVAQYSAVPGTYYARIDAAYFANLDVEDRIIAAPKSPAGRLVRDYASVCDAASAAQDRSTLDQILAAIDAASTPEDYAKVVAKIHDAGGDALFDFGAADDITKRGPRVGFISPAGFGLAASDYQDAAHADVLATYEQHITDLVRLAGGGADAAATSVLKIETALAKAETNAYAHPISVSPAAVGELENLAPHVSWSTYFASSNVPASFEVVVVGPEFFDELDALLVGSDPADLKAYLVFRTLEAFADTLPAKVVAEEEQFHDEYLGHFEGPSRRSDYCKERISDDLEWPLSQAFVAESFSSDRAAAAASLAQVVHDAFERRLAIVPWLDASTRTAAEKKLAAMRIETGGPIGTWPLVDGLTLDLTSFGSAQTSARTFARRRELRTIGQRGGSPWFLAPFVFNAVYENDLNAADVTAAFLQTPAFDPDFDPTVNLGATGAVIGHEMTHGFDADGRQFDDRGVLHDWWSAKAGADFDARKRCLIDQYDAFEVAPGLHVDGGQTLDENIADLGGVQVAFHELPIQPSARAFFIAYAQHLCEVDAASYLQFLIDTDPHAPPRARVNVVLSNMPEFAAAFECKEGAPMAPKNRCEIW